MGDIGHEFTTKDGRTVSKEMEQPFGGSKSPLTTQQFEEMYHKLTKGILSDEQVNWTTQILLNLDQIDDLQELMEVLTYRYAAKTKK